MSNNFPGGLIRKTPVTPAGPLQNGAAPGMWTLAEASFWTKQGLWPIAGNVLAVEDVFSTYLYTGNSGTQTITNGIDLAGKGGMVWRKSRGASASHVLMDTSRGIASYLSSNTTDAAGTGTNWINSFNSNGFTMNANSANGGTTYTSWSFRKAPNFFDVVTYTGNGGTQNIAHSLGVAPGMIIVKNTTSNTVWSVWHRSVNGGSAYAVLNLTDAFYTSSTEVVWGNNTTYVAPTTTQFTVGQNTRVNQSGNTFVAYLFAHDPSADGIIQCGSYTGAYPSSPTVTLGWEPQWVMIKSVNNSSVYTNWGIWDNMRGMPVGGNDPLLDANRDTQEGTTYTDTGDYLSPTATGFIVDPASTGWNINNTGSVTYIYVAIRRGPMRTPTLGTSVFLPILASTGVQTTGFPIDLQLATTTTFASGKIALDRLRGIASNSSATGKYLETNTTASELSSPYTKNWNNVGFDMTGTNFDGFSTIYWSFRRAPGFFDEVCYTGTGVARTVNHNLGVVPELMIVKRRSSIGGWLVFFNMQPSTYKRGLLNANSGASEQTYVDGFGLSAQPTSTVMNFDSGAAANDSGTTYVSYLFASVPGVSKVGTYTGNGSSQTINCAFTTGARFVLIKRTESGGDWYVWDSARGIVAGNDPYLALNTTAAEVTSDDSVDTDNTGFVVNQVAASNINVNAATYIFLAIA